MSYAKTLKGINDLDGINDINTHWGVEGYIVLIIDNWLWAGYVLTLDPTKLVSITKMVSMTSMDIEVLKDILLTIDNWLWTGYLLTPKTGKYDVWWHIVWSGGCCGNIMRAMWHIVAYCDCCGNIMRANLKLRLIQSRLEAKLLSQAGRVQTWALPCRD